MIKNDLFLRALKGETVDRPPVWMMRQAGRYLPEFMEIKAKYDFFTRCQTPELASEITVQPIRRYGMDAAILFSDILVIPQAMNIPVEMKPGIGPWLPKPIPEKLRTFMIRSFFTAINFTESEKLSAAHCGEWWRTYRRPLPRTNGYPHR